MFCVDRLCDPRRFCGGGVSESFNLGSLVKWLFASCSVDDGGCSFRRTDLGPVIRALWDRVACLRRLFPGVPLSDIPLSVGGQIIVSRLAHAGADIDELRFLYGGRLLGGMSSDIFIC